MPSYRSIAYRGLYPGIDLFFLVDDGRIKYEFRVEPGADPDAIRVHVDGAVRLHLTAQGELAIVTKSTEILDAAPVSRDARGDAVQCGYALFTGPAFGFDCSGWDGQSALIIDPLVYSVYFGTGLQDWAWGLSADANGSAYIAGYTASPYYPVTSGAFDGVANGATDIFVAKLNANGSGLEYLTYIGGTASELPSEISLGPGGSVYVAGRTGSPDFPTTPGAFDTSYSYKRDAFALQLDGTGSGLVYSTFLGGSGEDAAYACAVDAAGNLYLAGYTFTDDFPTTVGAFQRIKKSHPLYWDAFVAKLDPTGSRLLYSTLLGGWFPSEAYFMEVDSSGSAYVTGITTTDDFPVTAGAFETTAPGGVYPHEFYVLDGTDWDLFVTKVSPDGTALEYSTYLGGSSVEGSGVDDVGGIALDAQGRAIIVGTTEAVDFPLTPDARNTTRALYSNGFLSILSADGSSLDYSSFLGWDTDVLVWDVELDPSGRMFVIGTTSSSGTEVSPLSLGVEGDRFEDGFLLVFSPDGRQELYRTFVGTFGPADDLNAVAPLPGGDVLILGVTWSAGSIGTGPVLDFSSTVPRRVFLLRLDLGMPAVPLGVVFAADSPLAALTAGDDKLIALTRSGSVWSSADGLSWEEAGAYFAHSGPLAFTSWKGSLYVTQGPEPGATRREITINVSSDGGATWRRTETRVWLPAASVVAAQGFGGYVFAATCGANSAYTDGALLRSSDGNSWAVVNASFGKGVCAPQSMIVWKDALYAALQSGEILRTMDGKAWEQVGRGSLPQTFIDGGQTLYLGTVRGIRVKETHDGTNWTNFNLLQADASTLAGDAWGGGVWFAGTVDRPANYGFVANLTDRGFRNVFALPGAEVPYLRFFQGRLIAADSLGRIWATPQHVPEGPRAELSKQELSYDGVQQVQLADFEPYETVGLRLWDSKGRRVASLNQTTDIHGGATVDILPEESWTAGTYMLQATGRSPDRQLNGSYVWSPSTTWHYTPDRQVVVRATGPAGNLTRGSNASWNLTIVNNFNADVSIVLALTLVRPGSEPLLPAYFRVTLAPGEELDQGLVWAVPPSQWVGQYSAKVLVLTALPREGGQVIAAFSFQVVVA